MNRMLAVIVLFASSTVAHAQDAAQPAADPTASARAAYASFSAALDRTHAEKDAAKKDKLQKASSSAFEKFCAEFDKVDWYEWNLKVDADLVAHGVHHASVRAFDAEDFARARKGWEFLADELPSHSTTGFAVSRYLAAAYAATGAFDEGTERLRKVAPKLSATGAAAALMGVGDLLSVTADFEGARKAYDDARTALAKAGKDESLSSLVKMQLESRTRVGERVRDLEGVDAATGRKFQLSSAAGKPAICFAMTLLGRPHTGTLRTIAAVQKKYASSGLVVFGITSFDILSPVTKVSAEVEATLPRNPDDKDGEKVKVTRETFRKFVDTYRQRMRATFPFVVAADKSLEGYADFRMNNTLVLDAEQRIVLCVGLMDDIALRWIAQAVCDRWAATRAPAPPAGK